MTFLAYFGPTSETDLGVHIFQNLKFGNMVNLALHLANPKWKDDISKWGRKVPRVPTNEHGYEGFSLKYNLIRFVQR